MPAKINDTLLYSTISTSIFSDLAAIRIRLSMASFQLDQFLDPSQSIDMSIGTSPIKGVTNGKTLSFLTECMNILNAIESPADIELIATQSEGNKNPSNFYISSASKISEIIELIKSILDDLELVLAVDLKSSSIKLKQATRQWYAIQLAKLLSLARNLKTDFASMIDNNEVILKSLVKFFDEGKLSGFAKSIAINLTNDLSKQLEKEAQKASGHLNYLIHTRDLATEHYEVIKKQSLFMGKQYELLRNVDDHFKQAKEKIDEHLENASKSGLAKSFQDRRMSLEKAQFVWGAAFLAGIALMAGGVIFEHETLPPIVGKKGMDINAVLVRMLFAAPLVWLTWFAARQFGNNARLIEDYAFKESSALAYHGYKNEFLGDQDHETLGMLRKVAAENFGANPTRMLSGQEAASPMHELLEGALKKEGFDKIVTVLNALNPKAKGDDSTAKKDDKKDE